MPFIRRPRATPTSIRRCLGKLAKREDKRTLKLSNYLATDNSGALPPLQPLNLRGAARSVPMYDNDKFGDCGPAGLAHAVNTWRAAVARAQSKAAPRPLALKAVIDFYVAVTGAAGAAFDPRTGANDDGVVLLDMLKLAQKVGIGGHKIGAFVEVDLSDEQYDWASAAFGGLILGYQLPRVVQDGRPWSFAPPNLHGVYAPGSWGGHCVYEDANDFAGRRSVESWGGELDVVSSFDKAYRDEAYAVLSRDWIENNDLAPSGLAIGDLTSDLAKVQA